MIIEVLSDSTERYDRGEKFAHYRSVPSLRDYVLVSQHTQLIEHYRRQPNEDGPEWSYRALGPGEALRLGEHDDTIPLGRVYAKVFAGQ